MKEIWKSVVGYEGFYEVSNLGNVRSVGRWVGARNGKKKYITPKPKKKTLGKAGRETVSLFHNDDKGKTTAISRLVLSAFVGPCPEGMEACHFPDRDTTNNRLDNLRWDTPKANREDSRKHNTLVMGSKMYNAKLTEEDIPTIRERLVRGEALTIIAKDYGVNIATISDIRRGCTWNHVECPEEHKNIKARTRFEISPKGEDHPNAKFTDSQVRELRKLFRSGKSAYWLSKKMNMSHGCMWMIVTGRTYKNVKDDNVEELPKAQTYKVKSRTNKLH